MKLGLFFTLFFIFSFKSYGFSLNKLPNDNQIDDSTDYNFFSPNNDSINEFFVIEKIIKIISLKIIAAIIAYLVIGYYLWHIYVSIRCAPKIPKLTKEEKEIKRLKEGGFGKKLTRKLLLQESFSKLNPRNLLISVDLFMILHFISLI